MTDVLLCFYLFIQILYFCLKKYEYLIETKNTTYVKMKMTRTLWPASSSSLQQDLERNEQYWPNLSFKKIRTRKPEVGINLTSLTSHLGFAAICRQFKSNFAATISTIVFYSVKIWCFIKVMWCYNQLSKNKYAIHNNWKHKKGETGIDLPSLEVKMDAPTAQILITGHLQVV